MINIYQENTTTVVTTSEDSNDKYKENYKILFGKSNLLDVKL